ncbi:MAG: DUF4395 domain-containing protein [Bacteroidetes bacterium]|nr:DUF4395 domain-containing protein [Bacteroidota bacterium]
MSDNISCPVDHIKISANQVRLTALLVLLTAIAYLIVQHWWIGLILTLDFFFRAFGFGAYSPFNLISRRLERLFSLKPRWTDRAPKIFAAQLGFLFADLLVIAGIFELTTVANVLAGTLAFFAFLESALGICVGCHVYTFLKRLFPNRPLFSPHE